MNQDSESPSQDLSAEEKDNLSRSTKKVKRDGDSMEERGAPSQPRVETEQSLSQAMEESPKPDKQASQDEVMSDINKEKNQKSSVKRVLWSKDQSQELTKTEEGVKESQHSHDQNGQHVQENKKIEVGEGAFGPWMIADSRRRLRYNKNSRQNVGGNQASKEKNQGSGSRFETIAQEEEGATNEEPIVQEEQQIPVLSIEDIPKSSQEKNPPNQSEVRSKSIKVRTKRVDVNSPLNRKQVPTQQQLQE
ncbi:uncharacterized protein G2W53_044020 [Senna tora]|uniref:Uncharacterized protein n=1 Tax=Senna tora TaxID=362788 RepID=A0A834SJL7_9FABA|nr:uncharacterized protein G2W53_044020 [Senna tora]